MTLNGADIAPAATHTVTTNSFIAAGGDGFTSFANAPYRDTGLIDLEASVDYLSEHDVVDPAALGRAVEYVEEEPTPKPTAEPTTEPTPEPTPEPTAAPTPEPTTEPATEPAATPAPATEPTQK